MNGILWGTIFSVIIFAIPLIFVDNYISFLGQDINFYKLFVIYSILQQFIQTLFSFSVEKLYFEDKEKLANAHLFSFNLLNFSILILTALISQNALISICLTLSVLFVYVICLYIWQFRKFKIDFKFYKNIRYVSSSMVSAFAMMIIYLFGFKTAFSAGPEYLAAINIAGLCTDTQWDTMGAIETVANVDIAKDRYNYRKELKNGYFFTFSLILTSILMCYSMAWANKVDMTIITIYLAFQIADMLTDPFAEIMTTFTQIEYSPTLNTAIGVSLKIIRTLISITLISPYCTEIGQLTSSLLFLSAMLFLRFAKYKVVDGKLMTKTCLINNEAFDNDKTISKIISIFQEK